MGNHWWWKLKKRPSWGSTFNDRIRDSARGGGPFDDDPRIQGFATGQYTDPNGAAVDGTLAEQKASLLLNQADRIRMQTVGLSLTALSQGVSFWLAGGELLRSKSLDRNSYDSGDWFNVLDFTYQTSGFHLATEKLVQKKVSFPVGGPNQTPGVIVMQIDDTAGRYVDTNLKGWWLSSTPPRSRRRRPCPAPHASTTSCTRCRPRGRRDREDLHARPPDRAVHRPGADGRGAHPERGSLAKALGAVRIGLAELVGPGGVLGPRPSA